MNNQGDIAPDGSQPVTIPRPDHEISRASISSAALKVLYGLKEAGYQSFLVGGGVRDLLLGREPRTLTLVPMPPRKRFEICFAVAA